MTRNELYSMIEEGQNFHNTWVNSIKKALHHGSGLIIGRGDERKLILDSCALMNLYEKAIQQIEHKELHPQSPFKRIKEYCEEYSREFVQEYRKRDSKTRFSYLYMDRLLNWAPSDTISWLPTTDQLNILKVLLNKQIDEKILKRQEYGLIRY